MREQVITFDLDGTLITSDNKLIGQDKTIMLLKQLLNAGCKIVVNTGRLDHDIISIQKKYELLVSARVSQNGCVMVDNKEAYAQLMNKDEALMVWQELKKKSKVRTEINSVSNRYWKSMRTPNMPKEYYDSHVIVQSFQQVIMYQPVTLFLCLGSSEELESIQEYIRENCDVLQAVMTSPKSLEIYQKGISKGKAIRETYPKAMIYGIGDSENDFSVFENSDISFCVRPDVKERADMYVDRIDIALEKIKEYLQNENNFSSTR